MGMKPVKQPKIVVVLWVNQEFGRRVLTGVLEYTSKHRFGETRMLDAPEVVFPHIKTQLNEEADGLIAVLNVNEVWRLEGITKPMVLVPYFSTRHAPLPYVATDLELTMQMAVDHMASLQVKHLAIVPCHTQQVAVEQMQTFRRLLQGTAIDLDPGPDRETIHRPDADGDAKLVRWIQQLPRPCGIVLPRTRAVGNLQRVVSLAGKQIPHDLPVISLCDDPIAALQMNPPVTGIRHHEDRIGWLAAELIQRLCRGEKVESVRVPPVSVIRRASTNMTGAKHDLLTDALQYIQNHLSEPTLQAGDVADHVGVSTKSLHKHAVKALGHSVSDEIKRQRLNKALSLLESTDDTCKEIAYAVGMPVPSHFSRFIKHQTGRSPQAHRDQAETTKETTKGATK